MEQFVSKCHGTELFCSNRNSVSRQCKGNCNKFLYFQPSDHSSLNLFPNNYQSTITSFSAIQRIKLQTLSRNESCGPHFFSRKKTFSSYFIQLYKLLYLCATKILFYSSVAICTAPWNLACVAVVSFRRAWKARESVNAVIRAKKMREGGGVRPRLLRRLHEIKEGILFLFHN